MIKTVFTDSLPGLAQPAARLMDVHSRGVDSDWMQKRAAVFSREIEAIRPEAGHSFIHLISMGGMDHYGLNRNGDGFNEKSGSHTAPEPAPGCNPTIILDGGLNAYHPTFKKYAHVFKDHVNKDPALASGTIHSEAMNPEMHRGELIIKVSNDRWAPELQKLANHEEVAFSMSCKVPYDICTICHHKAANRSEYCDHAKNHMNQLTKSGHVVGVINDRPCFFDMSGVFRPADRIAFHLQKVAFELAHTSASMGGAELAEMLKLSAPMSVMLETSSPQVREKLAAIQHAASMEKQIEANGRIMEMDSATPTEHFSEKDLDGLRGLDVKQISRTLSGAKIVLPVEDFFKLILGPKYDSLAGDVQKVKLLMPGFYSRLSGDGAEELSGDTTYDPESPVSTSAIPGWVRQILDRVMPNHSLGEPHTGRRMRVTIIRAGGPQRHPQLGDDDGDQAFIPASEFKAAADDQSARYLAKQYAAYQLAFLKAAGGSADPVVCGLTVLRNYHR